MADTVVEIDRTQDTVRKHGRRSTSKSGLETSPQLSEDRKDNKRAPWNGAEPDKKRRRKTQNRSRSSGKLRRHRSSNDTPHNEVVESVERYLQRRSKSTLCDEFGNTGAKVDLAIFVGEEFQQDQADNKTIFERVKERDTARKQSADGHDEKLCKPIREPSKPPAENGSEGDGQKVSPTSKDHEHIDLTTDLSPENSVSKQETKRESRSVKVKSKRKKRLFNQSTKRAQEGDSDVSLSDADQSPQTSFAPYTEATGKLYTTRTRSEPPPQGPNLSDNTRIKEQTVIGPENDVVAKKSTHVVSPGISPKQKERKDLTNEDLLSTTKVPAVTESKDFPSKNSSQISNVGVIVDSLLEGVQNPHVSKSLSPLKATPTERQSPKEIASQQQKKASRIVEIIGAEGAEVGEIEPRGKTKNKKKDNEDEEEDGEAADEKAKGILPSPPNKKAAVESKSASSSPSLDSRLPSRQEGKRQNENPIKASQQPLSPIPGGAQSSDSMLSSPGRPKKKKKSKKSPYYGQSSSDEKLAKRRRSKSNGSRCATPAASSSVSLAASDASPSPSLANDMSLQDVSEEKTKQEDVRPQPKAFRVKMKKRKQARGSGGVEISQSPPRTPIFDDSPDLAIDSSSSAISLKQLKNTANGADEKQPCPQGTDSNTSQGKKKKKGKKKQKGGADTKASVSPDSSKSQTSNKSSPTPSRETSKSKVTGKKSKKPEQDVATTKAKSQTSVTESKSKSQSSSLSTGRSRACPTPLRPKCKTNNDNKSTWSAKRRRVCSESRGFFNKVSKTVGCCLNKIAKDQGKYKFPSRKDLFVPDIGMGRHWIYPPDSQPDMSLFDQGRRLGRGQGQQEAGHVSDDDTSQMFSATEGSLRDDAGGRQRGAKLGSSDKKKLEGEGQSISANGSRSSKLLGKKPHPIQTANQESRGKELFVDVYCEDKPSKKLEGPNQEPGEITSKDAGLCEPGEVSKGQHGGYKLCAEIACPQEVFVLNVEESFVPCAPCAAGAEGKDDQQQVGESCQPEEQEDALEDSPANDDMPEQKREDRDHSCEKRHRKSSRESRNRDSSHMSTSCKGKSDDRRHDSRGSCSGRDRSRARNDVSSTSQEDLSRPVHTSSEYTTEPSRYVRDEVEVSQSCSRTSVSSRGSRSPSVRLTIKRRGYNKCDHDYESRSEDGRCCRTEQCSSRRRRDSHSGSDSRKASIKSSPPTRNHGRGHSEEVNRRSSSGRHETDDWSRHGGRKKSGTKCWHEAWLDGDSRESSKQSLRKRKHQSSRYASACDDAWDDNRWRSNTSRSNCRGYLCNETSEEEDSLLALGDTKYRNDWDYIKDSREFLRKHSDGGKYAKTIECLNPSDCEKARKDYKRRSFSSSPRKKACYISSEVCSSEETSPQITKAHTKRESKTDSSVRQSRDKLYQHDEKPAVERSQSAKHRQTSRSSNGDHSVTQCRHTTKEVKTSNPTSENGDESQIKSKLRCSRESLPRKDMKAFDMKKESECSQFSSRERQKSSSSALRQKEEREIGSSFQDDEIRALKREVDELSELSESLLSLRPTKVSSGVTEEVKCKRNVSLGRRDTLKGDGDLADDKSRISLETSEVSCSKTEDMHSGRERYTFRPWDYDNGEAACDTKTTTVAIHKGSVKVFAVPGCSDSERCSVDNEKYDVSELSDKHWSLKGSEGEQYSRSTGSRRTSCSENLCSEYTVTDEDSTIERILRAQVKSKARNSERFHSLKAADRKAAFSLAPCKKSSPRDDLKPHEKEDCLEKYAPGCRKSRSNSTKRDLGARKDVNSEQVDNLGLLITPEQPVLLPRDKEINYGVDRKDSSYSRRNTRVATQKTASGVPLVASKPPIYTISPKKKRAQNKPEDDVSDYQSQRTGSAHEDNHPSLNTTIGAAEEEFKPSNNSTEIVAERTMSLAAPLPASDKQSSHHEDNLQIEIPSPLSSFDSFSIRRPSFPQRPGSSDIFLEDDFESDEFLPCSSSLFLSKNQNSSSCASVNMHNSFKSDLFYPQFAYHCGMVDTLKMLNVDSSTSVTTVESSCVGRSSSAVSLDDVDSAGVAGFGISDRAKSITSLTTLGPDAGDAFEQIRHNSNRALMYANSMTSWQAWSMPLFSKMRRSPRRNHRKKQREGSTEKNRIVLSVRSKSSGAVSPARSVESTGTLTPSPRHERMYSFSLGGASVQTSRTSRLHHGPSGSPIQSAVVLDDIVGDHSLPNNSVGETRGRNPVSLHENKENEKRCFLKRDETETNEGLVLPFTTQENGSMCKEKWMYNVQSADVADRQTCAKLWRQNVLEYADTVIEENKLTLANYKSRTIEYNPYEKSAEHVYNRTSHNCLEEISSKELISHPVHEEETNTHSNSDVEIPNISLDSDSFTGNFHSKLKSGHHDTNSMASDERVSCEQQSLDEEGKPLYHSEVITAQSDDSYNDSSSEKFTRSTSLEQKELPDTCHSSRYGIQNGDSGDEMTNCSQDLSVTSEKKALGPDAGQEFGLVDNEGDTLTVFVITQASPERTLPEPRSDKQRIKSNPESQKMTSCPKSKHKSAEAAFVSLCEGDAPLVLFPSSDKTENSFSPNEVRSKESELDRSENSCSKRLSSKEVKNHPSASLLDGKLKIVYNLNSNTWSSSERKSMTFLEDRQECAPCTEISEESDSSELRFGHEVTTMAKEDQEKCSLINDSVSIELLVAIEKTPGNSSHSIAHRRSSRISEKSPIPHATPLCPMPRYDSAPGRIESDPRREAQLTSKGSSFYSWLKEKISRELHSFKDKPDKMFCELLSGLSSRSDSNVSSKELPSRADQNTSRSEDDSFDERYSGRGLTTSKKKGSKSAKRMKGKIKHQRTPSRQRCPSHRSTHLVLRSAPSQRKSRHESSFSLPGSGHAHRVSSKKKLKDCKSLNVGDSTNCKTAESPLPVSFCSSGVGLLANAMVQRGSQSCIPLSPTSSSEACNHSEYCNECEHETLRDRLTPILEESRSSQCTKTEETVYDFRAFVQGCLDKVSSTISPFKRRQCSTKSQSMQCSPPTATPSEVREDHQHHNGLSAVEEVLPRRSWRAKSDPGLGRYGSGSVNDEKINGLNSKHESTLPEMESDRLGALELLSSPSGSTTALFSSLYDESGFKSKFMKKDIRSFNKTLPHQDQTAEESQYMGMYLQPNRRNRPNLPIEEAPMSTFLKKSRERFLQTQQFFSEHQAFASSKFKVAPASLQRSVWPTRSFPSSIYQGTHDLSYSTNALPPSLRKSYTAHGRSYSREYPTYGAARINLSVTPSFNLHQTRSGPSFLADNRTDAATTNSWRYGSSTEEMNLYNKDMAHWNWNESANNGDEDSGPNYKDSTCLGQPCNPTQSDKCHTHSDSNCHCRHQWELNPCTLTDSRNKQSGDFLDQEKYSSSRPVCPCVAASDSACPDTNDGRSLQNDLFQQYVKANKLALCAGRNINGSGNLLATLPHYTQVSQSLGYPVSADELQEARDEDYATAKEDTCKIDTLTTRLTSAQSSSGLESQATAGSRHEMDATCNHPPTSLRYIGDGSFATAADVSRDDILMNMSPCCPQSGSRNFSAEHSRTCYPEEQKYHYADSFRKLQPDCLLHHHPLAVHTHGLEVRRSFCGQGDTNSKRAFTEWYVDDHAPDAMPGADVTRDRDTSFLSSKRKQRTASSNSECCQSSEGSVESMVSVSSGGSSGTTRHNPEAVGARDREEDKAGSKSSSEYDFDDDEEGERFEDEEDGGEDDDDGWEDEEDDADDDVDSDTACGQLVLPRILESRNAVKDVTDADGRSLGNICPDEETRNLTQNKHESTMDVEGAWRYGLLRDSRKGQQRTGSRLKQEQQFSDLPNRSRHDTAEISSSRRQQQRSKSISTVSKKFSFDHIKVPSIEKDRVRFACSETGEWAEIGRGSYGCVYLGLLDGSVEVAIKDFYESSSWDLVIHEARMLLFLQDTGITPSFYGLRRRFDVTKEPSEYCIIMEYFGDGRTLFNVMSDKIPLLPEEWLDVVGQLVAGLRLIHSKNVLINDLKADNILIDLSSGRKTIRYIDVGMATYKQGLTFQLPQDQMNKYNFLAPEVREGAHTSTKSDIYSLGYMLEQISRLAGPALSGLDKLIARCTDKNPANRPDIDDIVSQVHWYIVSKASVREVSPQGHVFASNSV
ncbi:uncharacterized protein LOC101861464 [Aplysia californica]|uniref:Uncharacterized protein LOC101861464 n=1 Tax=Aplysia californica TaxID=6500 RepID=A0ABM0K2M5_APLCA|nr:uncharacterized protein LOC101861464 [Aplysia californica]